MSCGALEPLHVDDERDIAVAEDGAAGDAVDVLEVLFEAFDHDLLLADDVIDDQRDLGAAFGLAQHHEPVGDLGARW